MPYTTPAAYIQRFGLTEAVQLLADEQQLLTASLLQDAMAGTWSGSPSQAEQAAATDALARMQRQIDVASAFIDGYLRAVATLPLPEGSAQAGTLAECCLALTRFDLADDTDNATDRIDAAAQTWRAWLRDVSMGKVLLVATDGSAASTPGTVRTGQAASAYNWALFGGVQP